MDTTLAESSENEEDILKPKDIEFNNEISDLEKEINELEIKRSNLVDIIRNKIKAHVKNADDALDYVFKYIKLTERIESMLIEEINGNHTCFILCYSKDNSDEIFRLFKELCGKYVEIYNIDYTDRGYIIEFNLKKKL